jgi:hypothetical protein
MKNLILISALIYATCLNAFAQITINGSVTDVSCFGIANGSINLSVTGGQTPYTYTWSNVSNTLNLTNIPAGTYTVTVTDANTLTATESFNVLEPTQIVVSTLDSSFACSADCNGAIQVIATGGVGPLEFSLNNGGSFSTNNFFPGLCAGNYLVLVRDDNGCLSTTTSITITAAFQSPVVTLLASQCFNPNNCDGEITPAVSGGTAPYIYLWSNNATTTNLTGLCSGGTYSVSVIDGNNCIATSSTFLRADSATINLSVTNPTCGNSTDGSITATVTGGISGNYVFSWSNGATGATISGLVAGTYSVTAYSTINQCPVIASASLTSSAAITIQTTVSYPTCGSSDGEIEVTTTGGTGSLEYSIDGINYQANNIFSALPEGSYTVTVQDGSGCEETANVLLSYIAIDVVALDSSDCATPTGSITVAASGGASPYTYTWSNSTTGETNNSLLAGWYSVTVEDANGCNRHINIEVPYNDTCRSTISGVAYYDLNSNCQQDVGEPVVKNLLVLLSQGGGMYTNNNGEYSFSAAPGNYTVTPLLTGTLADIATLTCPVSGNIALTVDGVQDYTNQNFGLEVVPYSDVQTSLSCGVARPGFGQQIYANVKNNSTLNVSGVLMVELDNNVTYVSASPVAPDSVVGKKVYFNYDFAIGTLGSVKYFTVYGTIAPPPTVNIGDTLSHTSTVFPDGADSVATNNTFTCSNIVTGSYDPNDKQVTPDGDFYAANNEFFYKIRFQNTGTDTAFTVVIKDTLSQFLDPLSFKLDASSHPCVVTIEQNNILVFSFYDIMLPDSFVNEPASNGYVQFYINRNNTINLGETINNTAAIYFDFNEPIITNTVVNTYTLPIGIATSKQAGNDIAIYPNPTTGTFSITTYGAQPINDVAIYDMAGKRLVLNSEPSRSGDMLQIDMLHAPAGIYFVHAQFANGITTVKKMVKQ